MLLLAGAIKGYSIATHVREWHECTLAKPPNNRRTLGSHAIGERVNPCACYYDSEGRALTWNLGRYVFAAWTAWEKACTLPNTHRLRIPGQGPTFLPMFKPFRGPLVTWICIVPGSRLGPDLPSRNNRRTLGSHAIGERANGYLSRAETSTSATFGSTTTRATSSSVRSDRKESLRKINMCWGQVLGESTASPYMNLCIPIHYAYLNTHTHIYIYRYIFAATITAPRTVTSRTTHNQEKALLILSFDGNQS